MQSPSSAGTRLPALPQALDDCLADIRRQADLDVRTDDYNRVLYSTDASIYQQVPLGVAFPRHADEVQLLVESAARHGVPVLARAGGSSLAGQCVNEALVVDTTRHLNQLLEVNTEEGWARVQPGLVLDELNRLLRPEGLMFGPDPASSNRAAMGGIVSNNSTGSHSIMYGMTVDHVRAADVVLADGSTAVLQALDEAALNLKLKLSGLEGDIYRVAEEIRRNHAEVIKSATPLHWRRCGGFNLDRLVPDGLNFKNPADARMNLASLVSGAEGSLAFMREITLGLVERPRRTALAIVAFEDLFDALRAVEIILETDPSAVELVDKLGLDKCREVPAYARLLHTFVDGRPNCILITEYYGTREQELSKRVEHLRDHLKKRGVRARVNAAVDPHLQNNVWTVRKVGLGLLMSVKGDFKPIPFIEDAAVPVTKLAEYVGEVERFCNELGTKVAYYAHASAGCLHIRPMVNTKNAAEIAKLPQIARRSMELVKQYGGSLSSEHGDGRVRAWLAEDFYGPQMFGLFKRVKAAFDPHNLFNPGGIADPAAMTEHLRYGENYRVPEERTHLDFSEDGGFAPAVEMCNGAGVCRKIGSGVMCPSFMATREEEHSTRGRANALRAALSGLLPHEELTSKRMHDVMDLCIECKACKAECPSSVDMAKIKFEFLARYNAANGVPLRSRLFGALPRMSRMCSGPLAPMFNSVLRSKPMRGMLESGAGISARRPLPAFARETFSTWFRRKASARRGKGKHKVVLFNDTFNTYHDPHIAQAATEFLWAADHDVILPGIRCCGRPMISKGLVDEARAAASDTLTRLKPYAERGMHIVGLEPSCILSLRDEYRYLLPDDDRVDLVAEWALSFDEYVARADAEGVIEVDFVRERRNILLHGHCHQKALVGTAPTKLALGMPRNYHVEEVDSGCCGMAGSFGYEQEHLDISLKMAERSLLPAVRKASDDTIIVAGGTSCRHQIGFGTGRRALHPAEVLRDALLHRDEE